MRLHNNDQCYRCVWPGCEYRHHDRGSMRFHRMRHERMAKMGEDSSLLRLNEKKNKSKKLVIKLPKVVDRSTVKRSVKKPKRYESDS